MKTPCVAACKNNNGICEGCLRTVTEIANWSQFNPLQREEIMAQLGHRDPRVPELYETNAM